MNPHHLNCDELDYELAIRKIVGMTGVDQKRRALRTRLRDEFANPSEVPIVLHSEELLSELGFKVEEIQSNLTIAVKESDSLKVEVLKSRCLHLKNRLARFAITSPEYLQIYQVYQNTVKTFLDRIQEHNPRKHKKSGIEALPLPADAGNRTGAIQKNRTQVRSSSLNEGAPSLARQGFNSLTEQEKRELDRALKTVEDLTKKGNELSAINVNFSNLNLSGPQPVSRSEPASRNEPFPQALLSSSSSEENLMYEEQPEPYVPMGLPLQPRVMPYYRRHTLPVSKWSIKFTGDSSGLKLSDFLNQVEIMATAEEASPAELLRSAIYLFDGFAKTWYMANRTKYMRWSELVAALRTQFLPKDWDYWLLKDIENRVQKNDESFGVFLAVMELMFQELPYVVPERQKVSIVRRNLLPAYQDRLALYETETLARLNFACDRIEQSQYSTFRRPQNLDFQASVPVSNPAMREERVSIPQLADYRCFNCKRTGHHFNDCREPRRKFCFRCGKPDVVSLHCDCARAGNGEGGPRI